MDAEKEQEVLKRLTTQLLASPSTVVLTGPGISLDAGIPGLWGWCCSSDVLPAFRYISLDRLKQHPESIWLLMMEYEDRIKRARPTPVHRALARMERLGLCEGILTLTVDGLHRRAGNTRVIHLLGTMERCLCLECGAVTDRKYLDLSVLPPRCTCGGIMKHDVPFEGESPPEEEVDKALKFLNRCQLLLCIGVSGISHPVSRLVQTVASGGGRVVNLNPGVTSFPIFHNTLHLPFPFFSLIPRAIDALASRRGLAAT